MEGRVPDKCPQILRSYGATERIKNAQEVPPCTSRHCPAVPSRAHTPHSLPPMPAITSTSTYLTIRSFPTRLFPHHPRRGKGSPACLHRESEGADIHDPGSLQCCGPCGPRAELRMYPCTDVHPRLGPAGCEPLLVLWLCLRLARFLPADRVGEEQMYIALGRPPKTDNNKYILHFIVIPSVATTLSSVSLTDSLSPSLHKGKA
jgi:hypothetical protein